MSGDEERRATKTGAARSIDVLGEESEMREHLTVLLALRENLANVDVVPGVARHREPVVLAVHDLLSGEVLVERKGFLR